MSRRGTGFWRTSFRIVVFICNRAVVCCRCRSAFSLFCDCSCAVPARVISPHSPSRSIGLWVCRVFVLESWRMSRCGGFRRTSYRIVVFIYDRAVVCCRCRSLCSVFCGCSCAVPAPVNSPQPIAFARFVGVSGVRLGQMSRRISCVSRRALVAFRGCLREVADGTGQIRGLLCFWNLFKAAFCSAQSVIANVPGGNAGREFPARISGCPNRRMARKQ